MKIDTNIFNDLKILARSGTHPKVWIASALVYRNKVVSYGVNQMKTHPYQKRYGKNVDSIFWHSETSAIYTADKRIKFNKFEDSILYVARIKYDSSEKTNFVSGLASPCPGCLQCIKDYGIKKVIYTMNHIDGYKEHFGILTL